MRTAIPLPTPLGFFHGNGFLVAVINKNTFVIKSLTEQAICVLHLRAVISITLWAGFLLCRARTHHKKLFLHSNY